MVVDFRLEMSLGVVGCAPWFEIVVGLCPLTTPSAVKRGEDEERGEVVGLVVLSGGVAATL